MSAWEKIKKDLYFYRFGILAAALWLLLTQIFFRASCPVRLFFGLPCPACGMTRAFVLLLKGHPVEAMRMHPLLPFTAVGAGLLVFSRYFSKKALRFTVFYVILLMAAFFIVYAIRMASEFPDGEVMRYYPDGAIIAKIIQALS